MPNPFPYPLTTSLCVEFCRTFFIQSKRESREKNGPHKFCKPEEEKIGNENLHELPFQFNIQIQYDADRAIGHMERKSVKFFHSIMEQFFNLIQIPNSFGRAKIKQH